MLDPSIQPFCSIDLNPYFGSGNQQQHLSWMRWNRCVMGLVSSPHGCVRMQMFAKELVRGRPTDRHNPFFYDILRLNLPGDPTYDPTLPRVFKVDSSTGRLAADMVTYNLC
jgi:hypothetical protein